MTLFPPFALAIAAALAVTQDEAGERAVHPESADAPSTLSWADYDADGLVDVFVAQPDGSGRLLKNSGDGVFLDVTERAGWSGLRGHHAAVFADANGDGRLDAFLPAWRGPSRLLVQLDDGTFADESEASGIPIEAGPVDARWLDVDGDGDLDLWLTTLVDELVFRNDGRGRFDEVDLGLAPRAPAREGLPLPATLDEARARLGLAAPVGGGGPDTNGPGAPPGNMGFDFGCAVGIQDQANPSDCMGASSVPTLGLLHPISEDLFVDASNGHVGVGTTTPGVKLEVIGTFRASGNVRAGTGVFAADPPLAVTGTSVVTNLNADRVDGFDASAFAMLPIVGVDVAEGTLTGFHIADGTLTGLDLAANSIDAGHLAANSVTSSELASDSVGFSEIRDNAVGSSELTESVRFGRTNVNGVCAVHAGLGDENKVQMSVNSGGGGYFHNRQKGLGDNDLAVLITNPSSPNDGGALVVFDGVGNLAVRLEHDGDIVKTGNNGFVHPHPEDPARQIVYMSLEGGERGSYFRGSDRLLAGEAVITPARDWQLVTAEDGLTVQVTPRGECRGLYVAHASVDRIVVRELGGGASDVAFDYFVNGFRTGFEDHDVYEPNTMFLPTKDRWVGPLDTGNAPALVANGILRPDGTIDVELVESIRARHAHLLPLGVAAEQVDSTGGGEEE